MNTTDKNNWTIKEFQTNGLKNNEKKLIEEIIFLSENNECFATNEELANNLNISSRQVRRYLSNLKEKGIILTKNFFKTGTKFIEKRALIINELPQDIFMSTPQDIFMSTYEDISLSTTQEISKLKNDIMELKIDITTLKKEIYELKSAINDLKKMSTPQDIFMSTPQDIYYPKEDIFSENVVEIDPCIEKSECSKNIKDFKELKELKAFKDLKPKDLKPKDLKKIIIKKSLLDEQFDILWRMYPRKQGSKKKARESYQKAIKNGDATFEIVKNGLEMYLNYIDFHKVSEEYIKHGSTWFNQECWTNEYNLTRRKKENPTFTDLCLNELESLRRNETIVDFDFDIGGSSYDERGNDQTVFNNQGFLSESF